MAISLQEYPGWCVTFDSVTSGDGRRASIVDRICTAPGGGMPGREDALRLSAIGTSAIVRRALRTLDAVKYHPDHARRTRKGIVRKYSFPGRPDSAAPDVRLIVTDLDGTLLDEDCEIPPCTGPLLEELERRGIAFCPASGRQYANIVERFGPKGPGLLVIAENGTHVVQDGREISSDVLDVDSAREVLVVVRDLIAQGAEDGRGGRRGGRQPSSERTAALRAFVAPVSCE